VFSYGFIDAMVERQVYWSHRAGTNWVRELSHHHLRYGFDLFAMANTSKDPCYAIVSQHLWRQYGTGNLKSPRPQVMPFSDYARICFPAAFSYRGDTQQDNDRMAAGLSYDEQLSGPLETWLEFTLGATDVGGIRATPWQWYHDIQFHAWWNNARDAVGLYWWGRRLNPEWVRRAKLIVELALTAPQEQGTSPAILRYGENRWIRGYHRPRGSYNPQVLPEYWGDWPPFCP